MKCDIMVGSSWDVEREVIVDWDNQIPCTHEATWRYDSTCTNDERKLVPFFIHLCDQHSKVFTKFKGNLHAVV